jgi:ATP-dependent exoDNAse (exonuclease V) beta subunit
LANLSHLRDVWSLTQALLSPANRLSWLSMLRSPYCGLSLNDIHCIAGFNKKKSIYSALLQLDKIQGLSEEGRIRAGFFIRIMHKSLAQRYQSRLSEWVAQTLKELHMETILNQSQVNDLEQFWILLDRYEEDARLADMNEFTREFNTLYSQQATPSRLQIMTIHKSKGLEFDTVFLPGLGSQPNRGDKPMLRWLKLPTQKHGNLLLVSPVQAAHQEHCPLYDYLGQLDEVKSAFEAQRLLYVAVTRAKSRLYLLDNATRISKKSFRSMLKHQQFTEDEPDQTPEETGFPLPQLMKLPLNHYLLPEEATPFPGLTKQATQALSQGIPRLTGIVTHQLLQWICDHHPETPEQIPWNLARYEFRKLGFDETMQHEALTALQKQIRQLFSDPTGLWIIGKHDREHNEYELLVAEQNRPVTRILDRTFEDQGKHWIIDFKTGKEDEETLKQHQEQLNEYASCLHDQTALPIHCGVYYLPSSHWVTWEYKGVCETRCSK